MIFFLRKKILLRKNIQSLYSRSFLNPSGFTPVAKRGFTLFYAVLVASLLLAVGLAIFNITFKGLILSSDARESQNSFYGADTGLECALFWDLKHSSTAESPFGFFGDSLRSGLRGFWRFEEGAGSSVALDYGGSNNHGTLRNMDTTAAWTTGKNGDGLQYDGINDVVIIPDIDYSDEVTGSLWIYLTNVTRQQMILAQGDSNFEVQLQMVGNLAAQKFRIRIDSDGGIDTVDSNTAATTGRWYHIAWTYDGTDIELYINGSRNMTYITNTGSGNIRDFDNPYGIGARNTAGFVVSGKVDEVRLYNRVLSLQEIRALYQLVPNNMFVAPVSQRSSITCGGVDITDPATGWDAINGWNVVSGTAAATTTFDLLLDNGRCANIQVQKNVTQTTIISRGYNTCDLGNPRRLERAIRATY